MRVSKISDYQEALRRKEGEIEQQTVGEFAAELVKEPAILLEQLKDAGIPKLSASDTLTSTDKHALLKHLQTKHQPNDPQKIEDAQKIVLAKIEPEWKKLVRSVKEQKNGAEFDALEYLLGAVLCGENLDPEFQKLINLLIAKSVVGGSLPLRKLGRPKRDDLDSIGLDAAMRYWEMIDSGSSYDAAVERLSVEFHKSERHMMRLIAEHKKRIGATVEERTKNRRYWEMMYRFRSENPNSLDHYLSLFQPKIPVPEFTVDDYIEHLDELIEQLTTSGKPLTKKI